MLERSAYQDLVEWRRLKTNQGLLITGARQVGKTTLVRSFGNDRYDHVAEINFIDTPQAVETLSRATDAKDMFFRISVLAGSDLVPGNTLVFLDEVQEFQDVLTWLKFLQEDTEYDFILSGSMLGVDLFNVRSFPVGFVQELCMYPMTFFEFCKAAGLPAAALDQVRECFEAVRPVQDFLHEKLMDLFYKYLLVGGMPDAVNAFVETSNMAQVRNIQRAIYSAYERDITKYVNDTVERRHIKTIYEAIPNQLNSQNKRFKFTKLEDGARFSHMQTAFDWLEQAGIALPVLRVHDPVYPLGNTADTSSFKLFMNDVGLLTSRLMGDVDIEILNRRSSMNYGSIFENVVAQELKAQGFELFYYNQSGIGEVDFLVQDRMGNVSLIEVKSGKDYKRHRAMNNLLDTKNYRFKNAYVLHDGNVEVDGRVTYLPVYMASCMQP